MGMPEKNIYWRKIQPKDRVEEAGKPKTRYWVVHLASGGKALAFWDGQEASEAQSFLDKRAKRRVRVKKAS